MIKIVLMIAFVGFHFLCNNYSQNLVEFYYKRRIDIIHKLNRSYNESKLITFEDKLNWIAINDVSRLKGKCADKILLHQYSKRILKKDICNKILKIYDDPYKINISELPDQFVLKTNHGSGYNIIVANKTHFNINSAKKIYIIGCKAIMEMRQLNFIIHLLKEKHLLKNLLVKI